MGLVVRKCGQCSRRKVVKANRTSLSFSKHSQLSVGLQEGPQIVGRVYDAAGARLAGHLAWASVTRSEMPLLSRWLDRSVPEVTRGRPTHCDELRDCR